MKTSEFLKKYQPIPYQIFFNALKNDTFSHAYLLSGPKGSSLKNITIFLAKSIVCQKDIFACECCDLCERIEKDNYPSLFILDAKKGIKIQELKEKIDKFYVGSTEKNSKNIYIILNIEYLKTDCINMILKFLEEPPQNTYALFTSENEMGVLPTILSRCEIIRFNSIKKEYFYDLAKSDSLPLKEISLLSNMFNDYEEIKNAKSNPAFLLAEEFLEIFISNIQNSDKLIFLIEKDILNKISIESCYYIYDSLIILFKESLKIYYHEKTTLIDYDKTLIKIKENIKNLDEKIKFLMEEENLINKNINLQLLLLHSLRNLF